MDTSQLIRGLLQADDPQKYIAEHIFDNLTLGSLFEKLAKHRQLPEGVRQSHAWNIQQSAPDLTFTQCADAVARGMGHDSNESMIRTLRAERAARK